MQPSLVCLLLVGAVYAIWRLQKYVTVKSYQKNLAGPPSSSWFTGNLVQINDPDGLGFNQSISDKYGGAAKVHGLFGDEQIYISDPLAIRHVILTNQSSFQETQVFLALNKLMFGNALTAVHGVHHKKQRKILNPIFSPTHIRALFPVISRIASQAASDLEERILNGASEIDMMDVSWRIALEVIGQAGLGHSFGCIGDTSDNAYVNCIKRIFPTLKKLGLISLLIPVLGGIGTTRFRRRAVSLVPWNVVRECKHLIDMMDRQGDEILSARKASLSSSYNAGSNKDIITFLLQANKSTSETECLTEDEVLSQINLLIFASSDTTSSTLSRILETLARYPETQHKLRQEIMKAELDHPISSLDTLKRLPFLDAVVKETLRLYPAIIKWERTATQDITIPLHTPVTGTDGQLITQISVAKNQNIIIGIANCNNDSRIWGVDANEWRPERWLSPMPESLSEARIPGIYSNIMTFLGGDRACIGYSFALVEIKTVVATLISRFRFELPRDKIKWKAGFTQYPVIESAVEPQMPLKVASV